MRMLLAGQQCAELMTCNCKMLSGAKSKLARICMFGLHSAGEQSGRHLSVGYPLQTQQLSQLFATQQDTLSNTEVHTVSVHRRVADGQTAPVRQPQYNYHCEEHPSQLSRSLPLEILVLLWSWWTVGDLRFLNPLT